MKNKIILFVFLILSTGLKAQTGGPGQPEFMQFKPATATDLVNTSNGSFSYNIPLFEIGGYPVNLSYQSGIQMDDVASMVGLGWNINLGAINRNMRGLPDDYKGDIVKRTVYMKPNTTYGGNLDLGIEFAGFPLGVNEGFGIFYNNYNGYGVEQSFALSLSIHKEGNPGKASLGLGMKANSQSGVDLWANPSVSLKLGQSSDMSATGSLGGMISVNSKEGIKGSINASMNLSAREDYKQNVTDADGKVTTEIVKGKEMSETLKNYSASYSFSKTPEIPKVTYPFTNTSYTGSFKIGGELFFMHPNGELRGYYSSQELSTNIINTPAYGYLYSEEAPAYSDNVLLDYNREKDLPYIKDASVNIGIPFYTNDIYSVNAQGIAGSFQLNRDDIGVIFDNHVASGGSALNIGAEVGLGNAFHVGADVSTTSNSSSSGKWNSVITPNFAFRKNTVNELHQSAYFKNASDVSLDENGFYDKLQGDKAIKVNIDDPHWWTKDVDTKSEVLNDAGTVSTVGAGQYYKNIRDPRTVNIQYLTAAQASISGLNKKIVNYPINKFTCPGIHAESERVNDYRMAHHISEITTTNTDGMRYVFGLPTYNISQKEVSFTLESSELPGSNGLVTYNPSASWGHNGKDGFYESTELPPYVTSHLLTAVLSPDYIDVDNNGPSPNDIGNYVKVNYSYAGRYKWRTPYGNKQASFNKALLSDDSDNKASYVYGEKEIWYTHSIESKTEIAEFYYDSTGRKDGLGVINEQGGKDITQRLYKLDSIKVYSINERMLNGNAAIPIRIIYFNYDYELCPNIENSTASSVPDNGKLTLKKLSFTSGKSRRELLSPYLFSYGTMPSGTVQNPVYNTRNVNRWGYYQPNPGTSDINILGALSNIDFPYSALQNEQMMTDYSYAWNLTKLKLPSSGTIQVEYEPHHYAYTQDKRSMEMFPIDGTGVSSTAIGSSELYSLTPANKNLYIKFKLKEPITGPNGYDLLLYRYFNNNLSQFYYYRALVNLKPNLPEWISGYFTIDKIGLINQDSAFIKLNSECRDDKNCVHTANPIAKNAWQFMRMNRSDLCFGPVENIDGTGLEAFLRMGDLMSKVHQQTQAFIMGFNNYAESQQFAQTLVLNKSFLRLYSPFKNKITGGSRVHRIISDNNWNQETGAASESKQYTIDYEYNRQENNPVTGSSETVSSGVMEYEPFNGQDENPMRTPVFINQYIRMAPDNRMYVETPFNESLFPASNLTYDRVKITSNKTNLAVPSAGYQVIESYTAKDFPVFTDITNLGDNHEKKTNFLAAFAMSILGVSEFHDYITLSQGSSITLNDMHGKQKATYNYNSKGALVSSESFEYSLGSSLSLIGQSNNVYASDKLGVSVSAICDSRNSEHTTQVMGVNMNLDMTFAPFIPLTLFVPLPNMSVEESRINTVALNKIIQKKGIMTKKIVTENGASVATENILFDDQTGHVVISKTTNEFNDAVFKFHYPAQWIYDGLSASYVSSDLKFTLTSHTGNLFSATPAVYSVLAVGDEIVDPVSGAKYWVTSKGPAAANQIKLESSVLGVTVPISAGQVLQVFHPGRKNQLMFEAGSVVSLVSPINGNHIIFPESSTRAKILNASMQEFADLRTKYCDCDSIKGRPTNPTSNGSSRTTNPYVTGERGNWYSSTTWSYLTDRSRNGMVAPYSTDIRSDGVFSNYQNFWRYQPPDPIFGNQLGTNPFWQRFTNGWQWVETVTKKDVNGLTLETSDVLGRHNALLTGYNKRLVVAEAGNARINEILFDGFEDWYYVPIAPYCNTAPLCVPNIVNWNSNGNFSQDSHESHTGKYSGKLLNDYGIMILVSPVIQSPEVTETGVYQMANTSLVRLGSHSSGPTLINCTGKFQPTVGMKYVFSAWVRNDNDPLAITFSDPFVQIDNSVFHTSGNIIDGWQRIYGEFTIPLSAVSFNLSFHKGNGNTWYDDIRIYPYDARMISHVYDGNTQKLIYTLDENNYFTKFNYDAADNLESINKETEKGMQTLKEARSANVKLP